MIEYRDISPRSSSRQRAFDSAAMLALAAAIVVVFLAIGALAGCASTSTSLAVPSPQGPVRFTWDSDKDIDIRGFRAEGNGLVITIDRLAGNASTVDAIRAEVATKGLDVASEAIKRVPTP